MKSITCIRKRVSYLSETLRPITKHQEEWIKKHAFRGCYWKVSNVRERCMTCGKLYETKYKVSSSGVTMRVKNQRCPCCGDKKEYMFSNTRANNQSYVVIMTRCKEWQVFRTIVAIERYTRKDGIQVSMFEAVQNWINAKGERFILSRSHYPLSSVYNPYSTMRFRKPLTQATYFIPLDAYDGYAELYPIKRVIPELRRNGFNGNVCGVNVIDLTLALLKDNMVESLYKTKQYKLVKQIVQSGYSGIPMHCLKLVMRHGYIVNDALLWIDYLNDLKTLDKDTHNPKYVCSKDLLNEHKKTMELVQKMKERERKLMSELTKMKEASEKNQAYALMKQKYLDIRFDNGHLFFHVLQSPVEFYEEGKAMKHCVERYWTKINSLIFSVRDEKEKRIETVEVSLLDYSIVQSRGHCNKDSEFHDEVIQLMKDNMYRIRKVNRKDVLKKLKIHHAA